MNKSKTKNLLDRIKDFTDEWIIPNDRMEQEYSWLLDYSEARIDEAIQAIEYLDGKADSLLRIFGTGLTAIGLIFVFVVGKNGGNEVFPAAKLFTPVFCWMASAVIFSFLCTKPSRQPTRPYIICAFTYARENKFAAKFHFFRGLIHLQFEIWVVGWKKADQIRSSIWSFLLAMLFWLPVGGAIILYRESLPEFIYSPCLNLDLLVLVLGVASAVGFVVYRLVRIHQAPLGGWEKVLQDCLPAKKNL